MSVKEDPLREIPYRPLAARTGDFFELLKPRVMALAIFTALVGLVAAPGAKDPAIALTAIAAIAIGAGAAGALNMWYDADIDAMMSRTSGRPIPMGHVDREEALVFGLVLSVLSVLMLGITVGWRAGALLAFTIFFYAVVYTMWLKRSTPQNIVIGGGAGALPPVIGWTAATGAFEIESLVLFLIIFLWTPPHFWALALLKTQDYSAAGIPMMPNVAGAQATRRQIFVYSLLLAPIGILPSVLGFAGAIYGTIAVLSGVGFVWRAWKLLAARGEERKPAGELFAYSILYLFTIFAALLLDTVVTRSFA
ncbi:MAG: heme o synthase [Rhizobiaceae bacterium]|nr:heme o synthase [Rhizobiaceae bacterium]MCV0407085.1 heme o synthase [Rhizobiaceae bacterium]